MRALGKVFNNYVLGVLFIALLVAGVWAVNGVFTQKFISFDKVTLSTDTTGLQLPAQADVKVRGVLVGEVLKAQAGDNGATLTLGIDPDKIDQIPKNVTASILPKTLFGEKYVELDIPSVANNASLKVGDHIVPLKVSVGCALAPDHASDPEELLASADLAAQAAKRTRGGFRMFEPAMRSATILRRIMKDELRDAAVDLAQRIAANGPLSMLGIKQAVTLGEDLPLAEAMRVERAIFNLLRDTADRVEGREAFREKRPPRFTGR